MKGIYMIIKLAFELDKITLGSATTGLIVRKPKMIASFQYNQRLTEAGF